MKKIKTPILNINGIDYTSQLRGKTFTSGTELLSINQKSLPETSFEVKVRVPYTPVHGFTDISNVNNLIVDCILYDANLNPILTNVIACSGYNYHISNGGLYYNKQLVEGQETGWTDLADQRGDFDFNNVLGIKNGAIYNIKYETRQIIPQQEVVTQLYAWTGVVPGWYLYPNAETQEDTPEDETVTIYTLTTNPSVGDKVYDAVESEYDTITAISNQQITINTNITFDRDSDKDTTNTKIIPAEYQSKVWCDLIDDSKTYIKIAGQAGQHEIATSWYTYAYALTDDNKLYTINGKTLQISLTYSNIKELYKSPKSRDCCLAQTTTGYIRRLPYDYDSSSTSYSTKLNSDQQFIAPTGYKANRYTDVIVYIVDGNLYTPWGTIFDNDGHWTHVSCGYECGYGICDGKLYKLYGTNSQWYNKPIQEIKLIDSSNIWVELYCYYSVAYGLTKDGKLYKIDDEALHLQKTDIPMGSEEPTIEQTITVNVEQQDTTKSITLSKALLNALIADSEP